MFDHLSELHKPDARRAAGSVAVSILFHLALLATLVYGVNAVRRGGGGDTGAGSVTETSGGVRLPGEPPPSGGDEADLPAGARGDLALSDMVLPARALLAARITPVLPRLPDTMELGRPRIIGLTVPPNRIPADSLLTLTGRGTQGISSLRVSDARQASLYGDALVVRPQSPPLQLTDSARVTQWFWSITPTRVGRQTIYLQLDAVAEVNGQSRVVTLQRIGRDVIVRATALQRVSDFFSHNWTWLSVLSLLAFIGWGRARLARS